MFRGRNLAWPVLALIASFVFVFMISFLAGSNAPKEEREPTSPPTVPALPPEPPAAPAPARASVNGNEIVITVDGWTQPTGPVTAEALPAEFTVLERMGDRVCLTVDPEQWGWRPEGAGHLPEGRWCQRVEPGTTTELRFVRQ